MSQTTLLLSIREYSELDKKKKKNESQVSDVPNFALRDSSKTQQGKIFATFFHDNADLFDGAWDESSSPFNGKSLGDMII